MIYDIRVQTKEGLHHCSRSNVRNFWKMICDHKIAMIVMLSDLMEGGQEASTQYWPSNGIYQYGEYIVDQLGEERLQGFIVRNLSVMDIKVHSYVEQLLMSITLSPYDRFRRQAM